MTLHLAVLLWHCSRWWKSAALESCVERVGLSTTRRRSTVSRVELIYVPRRCEQLCLAVVSPISSSHADVSSSVLQLLVPSCGTVTSFVAFGRFTLVTCWSHFSYFKKAVTLGDFLKCRVLISLAYYVVLASLSPVHQVCCMKRCLGQWYYISLGECTCVCVCVCVLYLCTVLLIESGGATPGHAGSNDLAGRSTALSPPCPALRIALLR